MPSRGARRAERRCARSSPGLACQLHLAAGQQGLLQVHEVQGLHVHLAYRGGELLSIHRHPQETAAGDHVVGTGQAGVGLKIEVGHIFVNAKNKSKITLKSKKGPAASHCGPPFGLQEPQLVEKVHVISTCLSAKTRTCLTAFVQGRRRARLHPLGRAAPVGR